MEAFSHTARQTYLSCPRKFYLSRMLRLERQRDPAALRMGKAMADALEAADDVTAMGGKIAAAHGHIEHAYQQEIDRVHANPTGTTVSIDRLRLEQVQLLVLSERYLLRYGGSLLAAAPGAVIATEREVEFDDPILGVGRLDAIVESGMRRIGIEDKLLTAGFWRDANERQLRINAQVTAYFAAMRAAGTPIDELRYRVTFKPTIKPNSRTGETLDQYAERLTDRIDNDPSYAFREYQLTRTEQQLDMFVRRVEAVNRAIARSKRDVKRYGEAAFPANMGEACTQFGECEFLELCIHGRGAPGYRVKPARIKLTAIQHDCLGSLDNAFHPEVRIADVQRITGRTHVRDPLERLVTLGLATKERRGRAAVYQITDAGREWLS